MLPCGIPLRTCLAASLLIAACAAPPNPEMDRAQGAIDAAGAAGAEQYAVTEYSAATTALKNATDAVAAGDYRLALNYALESHEHARNAARDTADTKARLRADVDRAITEIGALIDQGEVRITAAGRAGVARRLLAPHAASLKAAEASLQKAGEAVMTGDYLAADAALKGVRERVDQAVAAVDAARTSQSARRGR